MSMFAPGRARKGKLAVCARKPLGAKGGGGGSLAPGTLFAVRHGYLPLFDISDHSDGIVTIW
jgi:hypothetical protein